jgi:hypothetical protein
MADVFRNARLGARLAVVEQRLTVAAGRTSLLEQRIVELCTHVAWLMGAVERLGLLMNAQAETLPGERPLDSRAH